ncbi:1739_t:CDS:2, partial [Acaulospora morrowiae]
MPKEIKKQKERKVYSEPSLEQITALKKRAVVDNTHKSTQNWLKQFELYRQDTNLPGTIEDIADVKQLEDELIKYFTVMRKNNETPYSISSIHLWTVLNGKFYELSKLGYNEIKDSNALTLEEIKIILNNSTTSKESPREASNFIKQKNEEGYIIKIYKSKTNQRTADCPGQAETFNIPNLSD